MKKNEFRLLTDREKQITPMENEIDDKNMHLRISRAVNKAAKICKLDSPIFKKNKLR